MGVWFLDLGPKGVEGLRSGIPESRLFTAVATHPGSEKVHILVSVDEAADTLRLRYGRMASKIQRCKCIFAYGVSIEALPTLSELSHRRVCKLENTRAENLARRP